MDVASNYVVAFLEALQRSQKQLIETLHNQLIQQGAISAKPFLIVSAQPYTVHEEGRTRIFQGSLSIGIRAVPQTKEPVDFSVDLLWDKDQWFIQIEIWRDSEQGQTRLISLQEKRTTKLDEAIIYLEKAIAELGGYAHLL